MSDDLDPRARDDLQATLDGIARRLLAERHAADRATDDDDAVGAPAGRDDGLSDDVHNRAASFVERCDRPRLARRQRDFVGGEGG